MCGYVLWLNVCSVCVCEGVGERRGGWRRLAFGSGVCVCERACACVRYCFLSRSENICIPLNPACVALIISCMHQGFSLVEITRARVTSHAAPKRREPGARWSLPPPARALEGERRQRWESMRSEDPAGSAAAQCGRSSSTY